MKPTLFAIDIDGTWTEDPGLFDNFVIAIRSTGYQVIFATGREGYSKDMERFRLPSNIPVIYCGNRFKAEVCKAAGYDVDIWIDNEPGTIMPPTKLADVASAEL